MTKLEERLNQLAEKIVIKLDEKGREYDVCDFGLPIADDCEMQKMISTVRDEIKSLILELTELKALVDKHEQNAHQSNCEFCVASDRSRAVYSQWRSLIGIDEAAPGADVTKVFCTCPACKKIAQVGPPSEYEPTMAPFHCQHCGAMGSIDPSKYESETL